MSLTIINAVEMEEGDGASVKRLFPVAGCRNIDPFVLFDEFFVTPPAGFPPHPHRGFEAITYMFDGSFQHEDNLGNSSVVDAGGAQRFTAGRGLVHSEMPKGNNVSHGIQLWINLAVAQKKIDPAYQQVNADSFPVCNNNGVVIRTIVGDSSPLQLKTAISYLDISFTRAAATTVPYAEHAFCLVYVVEGELLFDSKTLSAGQAAIDEGRESIVLKSSAHARAIFLAASARAEPIFQHGPYVD
ncbi:MAG: pirin family protein [Proteobacteria bacterium]|nr:pirin family protein [Pseudomonadota bacterium]